MAERKGSRPPGADREDPATWVADRPRWTEKIDLDRLIRTAPHGVAAAVVDLASGTTIAARSFERALERDLDLLAESAEELFHRADLSALETSLPGLTPDSGGRREAVQKVIAQSRHLLYLFLRSQVRPNLILVTLCRADANLGMAMMVAREALEGLEKLATER